MVTKKTIEVTKEMVIGNKNIVVGCSENGKSTLDGAMLKVYCYSRCSTCKKR